MDLLIIGLCTHSPDHNGYIYTYSCANYESGISNSTTNSFTFDDKLCATYRNSDRSSFDTSPNTSPNTIC